MKSSTPFLNVSSFSYRHITFFFLILFGHSSFSQTTETLVNGNTWTVPCGVTQVMVEAWGAGGGGARITGNPSSGGGGSGGGYVKAILNVIPNTQINYSIGAAGSGGTATKNGGSTWFFSNTTLLAVGGRGATNLSSSYNYGSGATAPNSGNIGGNIVSSYGGNGGTAAGGYSGGGGSSGGSTTAGNANGQIAGVAPGDGYAGASGRESNGSGMVGNVGAGGAGGKEYAWFISYDRDGGNGGSGQIRITYTVVLNDIASSSLPYGQNVWNIYGWNGGDAVGGSGAWFHDYRGYYTASTIHFNSVDHWGTMSSPSSATGWSGCAMDVENSSFTAKRQGFPCGRYRINVERNDDAADLYVNDVLVWSSPVWSGSTAGTHFPNVWEGYLSSQDRVEFRVSEGTGNFQGYITLNPVAQTLVQPTSLSASNQAVCSGSNTTLTAVGGTASASTLWFEGTCGNVLFSEEWNSNVLHYPSAYCTVNSVSGGVLNVTSHAYPDAQISMENIFSSAIMPATYRNIAFRYRVVSGVADQAEIYFKKVGQVLAEDKVVKTNLISDGNWHIANFNMTSNSNWNNTGGNITGWRFDWTRGANVRMEIDYIVLTDRPVLENTNSDENIITVTPTGTSTTYYAMRVAESTCFNITPCASTTVYRGKTWNGGSAGNWSDANSWIPSGVPTIDDCITIPSTFNMAIAGSHGVGRTLNVSGGNFTINSGNSITIRDAVTVAPGANFILENSASLVQQGTTNTNFGNITVRRNAKPMKRFDFTYWSSPVAGQSLLNFSPYTLRDKYYSWDIASQSWTTHLDGNQIMQAGKGYIVRAPQSFDVNTAQIFASEFRGVPNNGTISIGVTGSSTTDRYNLIGNPYPSAIDMDLFFTDADNTELEQTIYLWTHNSPPNAGNPGNAQYNYAASDYAVYNRLGGVATSPAVDNPFDPVPSNNFNNAVPNRHLAAGQAFFIKGLSSGSVRFTNAMRVTNNNNNFFRTRNSNSETNGKNRFWLNLRNNEGAFNQTLVGYSDEATNEYDNGFDGELFGGNYVTVYSILNDRKLSIQGKSLPFSEEDVVPIGVTASISGQFSLSLDNYDGLFSNHNIFLRDNLLNVYHSLKDGGYSFSMNAGTYNDRFEIVFRNGSLSTPKFSADAVIVYQQEGKIVVDGGKTEISGLKIFDVSGRIIFEKNNINSIQTSVENLSVADQVLLINILTPEGNVTKKLIYKK